MAKIMVVGDVHGDTAWTNSMIMSAGDTGHETIVQVGDFGSGFRNWQRFADSISKVAAKYGVKFYFIDGNHDSTDAIYAESVEQPDGFWQVRENLLYIPRGHTWEWDGYKFMGIGGAVSIDKTYRLAVEGGYPCPEWNYYPASLGQGTGLRTQWWPTEQITDAQAQFAKAQGPVDILFTHDCPEEFVAAARQDLKPDTDSRIHRQKVADIARAVQPKVWFHGHMHTCINYSFMHEGGYTDVIGLACNGMSGNGARFDTSGLVL